MKQTFFSVECGKEDSFQHFFNTKRMIIHIFMLVEDNVYNF